MASFFKIFCKIKQATPTVPEGMLVYAAPGPHTHMQSYTNKVQAHLVADSRCLFHPALLTPARKVVPSATMGYRKRCTPDLIDIRFKVERVIATANSFLHLACTTRFSMYGCSMAQRSCSEGFQVFRTMERYLWRIFVLWSRCFCPSLRASVPCGPGCASWLARRSHSGRRGVSCSGSSATSGRHRRRLHKHHHPLPPPYSPSSDVPLSTIPSTSQSSSP